MLSVVTRNSRDNGEKHQGILGRLCARRKVSGFSDRDLSNNIKPIMPNDPVSGAVVPLLLVKLHRLKLPPSPSCGTANSCRFCLPPKWQHLRSGAEWIVVNGIGLLSTVTISCRRAVAGGCVNSGLGRGSRAYRQNVAREFAGPRAGFLVVEHQPRCDCRPRLCD